MSINSLIFEMERFPGSNCSLLDLKTEICDNLYKLIQDENDAVKEYVRFLNRFKSKLPAKVVKIIDEIIYTLYRKKGKIMTDKKFKFSVIIPIYNVEDYLEETMNDTEIELEYSRDPDAKIGHKTADTEFFGYKTHIMMETQLIMSKIILKTLHQEKKLLMKQNKWQ